MRARALWMLGVCVAVGPFASACDGGETGTGGGGSGGSGAATTTSQGGEGGAGAAGGGGAGGSGGGAVLGPFTSQGATSYETQTSLAADGKGGVVATWIGFSVSGSSSDSGIGYAVSRDGGKSWTAPALLESPDGRLASNPVVVADSKGQFSLAWLGFRIDGTTDEHVYVAKLDAKTETFGEVVIASDDGTKTDLDFDKPDLAVDATDALLLTWADFSATSQGGPAALTFARSTDGKTFARSEIVSDATFGNLASLCLDTAGGAGATLYVVHLGPNGTVALRTSVNQGQSWELRPTPATQTVFQDITCTVKGTALTIAYASGTALFSPTDESPGDDVKVMRSADGGVSFDSPVTVSDGAASDKYLYPQLVRAPSGDLAIVYHQGVVDGPAQLVLATSADGITWSSAPVASSGTFTLDRTIASWLGGYVGLAIPGEVGLVSYAENTENKAHIAFAEVALP